MTDEYTPQHAPEPVADTPKRSRRRPADTADDGTQTVTVAVSNDAATSLKRLRTVLTITGEPEHPIFDKAIVDAIAARVKPAR